MKINKLIKILAIFGISVILSACKNQEYSRINEGELIIAVGGHLTSGKGARPEFAYPGLLGKKINRVVLNESGNSYTSKNVLDKIDSILSERKPKLILLEIGSKDAESGLTDAQTYSNIKEIISKIKKQNSQVILLATPNYKASNQFLVDNEMYKTIGKEEDVLVASIFSDVLTYEEYRFDKTMLNKAGYELMAIKIQEYLNLKKIL